MDRKKFGIILASIGIILLVGHLTGVRSYVTGDRLGPGRDAFSRFADTQGEEQLRIRITEEAAKRRIEPINAVVDRVWKAIPGYNGREVDIERTYQQARVQPPGTPITYIYKDIEPKVSLDDLGAQPIYRGNSSKPMAALMINVAWGNEYITPMLDVLEAEGVKATFFFDGSWLKKNTELAKEIQKRGHQLENHAYSHPNMSQLGDDQARLEISKTKELLKETLGVQNRWFAPPSGDFNDRTVKLAAEQGLKTVLWTVDTIDWRKPPADTIISRVEAKVGPGSLILMHPTASTRDALQGIIKTIRSKGLQPGTVEETLSSDRLDLQDKSS
ncbi:polysaccharide deacetylase family protein [Paenibacillus apis]|uniref:NodB homology domain-containing protein n=1 Tax=Paenibacillus apis TaxID=1792174 RepID=A0A919Y0J3_9BACL|nr:polysaccharide deacetylase family protein [Paenibacillus apis]GIO41866.1 hypothetical protein J41TS4_16240 [Paenibacillus apis]